MSESPRWPVNLWVETLGLKPHPEGGHFAETWRASEHIEVAHLPARFDGPRAFGTSIYYLLHSGARSAFHRIRQDEIWHHHAGDPLLIHAITPEGDHHILPLGLDLTAGQRPQQIVPAGWWFGAEVARSDGASLVGCTVAPGFDFADFEMADPAQLTAVYPAHAKVIARLATADPSAHPPQS